MSAVEQLRNLKVGGVFSECVITSDTSTIRKIKTRQSNKLGVWMTRAAEATGHEFRMGRFATLVSSEEIIVGAYIQRVS